MSKKSVIRSYNFELIIYKEHWNDDLDLYLELEKLKVACCLSPLHDKDKFKTGENAGKDKKPHYHCLLHFETQKSLKQVQEIVCGITDSNLVSYVYSLPAATRYLSHIGEKDKPLYDEADVNTWGGFDYEKIKNRDLDKESKLNMVIKTIENNNIRSYYHLVNFIRNNASTYSLLPEIAKNRAFYEAYIHSMIGDEQSINNKSAQDNLHKQINYIEKQVFMLNQFKQDMSGLFEAYYQARQNKNDLMFEEFLLSLDKPEASKYIN